MAVEFKDFSIKVKDTLEDKAIQWLEEASVEIESAAKRNTDFAPRSLKGDWKHVVDESKKEATVGHPKELAIWMEMGTGEYALKGNGRKGYWVYVKGNDSVRSKNPGKVLTLEEAKRQMAFLRSKGLDAHITNGHRPMRMLYTAFTQNKAKLIRRAEQLLKGL
jgi:hypothetical protein